MRRIGGGAAVTEPAFPVNELNQDSGGICAQHFGLTMRDYFAAKAMQGILAADSIDGMTYKIAAYEAYRFADAMMEAGEA